MVPLLSGLPQSTVGGNTWSHFLEPEVSGKHFLTLSWWKFKTLSSLPTPPGIALPYDLQPA